MAQADARLIVVPQYPTPLRYPSWWRERFNEYARYFAEVLFLDPPIADLNKARVGAIAPTDAIGYEIQQMTMFNNLVLQDSDVLLLCDLSHPGLFASMLFHKRPKRCFAICHATSINRFDMFAGLRIAKWPVERGTAHLFDAVFVASAYHKQRLGWPNTHVVKFPLPRVHALITQRLSPAQRHLRPCVSVARNGVQKIDRKLEDEFMRRSRKDILRFYQVSPFGRDRSWTDYYQFIESAKVLIVSSREETYGYQVIDALSVGTVPLAPRALAYPEILPDRNLYEPRSVHSLIEAFERNIKQPSLPVLWQDKFIEETAAVMQ